MLNRKPRVGMDVTSYCGKCKMERTHTIAAMEGETIRKVTCSMCNSTHNHKSAPAAKSSSRSTSKTGTSKRRASSAFSIDPNRPAKNYDMNGNFSEGDVINHPKFGMGNVQSIIPPNKIEVRFQEGTKILLQRMR